jgi:hypothetical protein
MNSEFILFARQAAIKRLTKKQVDWPDQTRKLISNNYSDEQRHLAFIEQALKLKSWEQRPSAAP